MSSEESNKTSKQTPSQDSVYNEILEKGNDLGPDVTDMLWTAARKQAMERLHEDLRKDKDSATGNETVTQ